MSVIRVLGVAPYEGMRSLMMKVAETHYPDISLNVVVGDLQKGVEIAQKNFHANYDVIISRGGTAGLIRDHVSIPVIEIAITEYDLLRALHLAKTVSKKCAVVGFPNVTGNAVAVSKLASIPLEVFTVYHENDIEGIFVDTASKGFDTILCDTVACTTAQKLGINAVLITSSHESVCKAFNDAISLCANMERLRAENYFFRELLNSQSNDTVVFNEENNLYFSSLEFGENAEVIHMLKAEIPHCSITESSRIIKSLNGSLYTIKAQQLPVNGKTFTTFYINRSKNPIPSKRFGISYRTNVEALADLQKSFTFVTRTFPNLDSGLPLLIHSTQPIMILGEYGVEKDYMAAYIYTQSNMNNFPLITINCSLLNEKSWDYLLSSHNSPFAQSGNTIYFSHISDLSDAENKLLMGAVSTMDVCKRNRVFFSSTNPYGENHSKLAADYISCFQCKRLTLPPLRSQVNLIPAMISLYLNQLNQSLPQELIGIEPDALKLIQSFPWPHNHTQLRRVLHELATNSTEPIISQQMVQQILQLEKNALVVMPKGEASQNNRFDLNRTLDELTKDIVQRVLADHDGNQTATAKQLGISRTTLWRLLKR